MEPAVGYISILSMAIIAASMLAFWQLWLKQGYYVMPLSIQQSRRDARRKKNGGSIIQETSEINQTCGNAGVDGKVPGELLECPKDKEKLSQDEIDTNLFSFVKKMAIYLYFTDRELILKDIGFEQMLYIYFLRRWIVFFFFTGIAMIIFLLCWARLTTSNWRLIFSRLLGSKGDTITSLDADTFLSCIVTVGVILQIFNMRKYLATRLSRTVVKSETIIGHRKEIWHQIRTVKFRGIEPNDKNGKAFRSIIEAYMRLHDIEGSLEKVILLPHLNTKIKLEKEREDITLKLCVV